MTDSRRPLFFGACAAMFLFGIVLAVLGVLFGLPQMRERLGISLVQQGDILLTLFFGVFASTIFAGPTIDSFGNKAVLVTSSAFVTIALSLFASAHSSPAAMAAAFLLGFGGGGLNTSANVLVADLYPEDRAARLSVVQAFYGFGALAIPLLAASITSVLSIPQLLLVGAALGLCCTIGYAILPFPPLAEKIGFSPLASILAIRHPGVIVVGVLLMCQSGNEAGIGGWMSTYAGSIGATPKIATWVLAGYWAALMLGRIAGARILRLVPKRRMVLMSGLGSAAGAAVILAANSIAVLAAGAVLIGASFATVYPTMLAIVADRYHRLAGTIFSLLFAMGLCGGMLFPWMMGHMSQSASLRVAMTVPLAGALIICVLAVVQSRD